MKIRKITPDEEQLEKQKSWESLTCQERLEQHSRMLRRIYGKWESVTLEGQKVKKYRSIEEKWRWCLPTNGLLRHLFNTTLSYYCKKMDLSQ